MFFGKKKNQRAAGTVAAPVPPAPHQLNGVEPAAVRTAAPAASPLPAPTHPRPVAAITPPTQTRHVPTPPLASAEPKTSTTDGSADAGPEEVRAREDQQRRAAVLSKRISAGLGEIASVLMRSKTHAQMPLAQLHTLMPAVLTGQYVTAEAKSRDNGLTQPVAVVVWASVSDEVDHRLAADPQQPLGLSAAEWTGGSNVWVVEAVGDARAISMLVKRLHETHWKDRSVKARARDESGRASIKTLTAPASSAANAA